MLAYLSLVACLTFFRLSIAAPTPTSTTPATPTFISKTLAPPSNISTSAATPTESAVTWWKPLPALKWQIVLDGSLGNLALPNVSVYEVDLDYASKTNVKSLHANGMKVICYFSAGSLEDFRPDKGLFNSSDLGNGLSDWPREKWLNIRSPRVLAIMTARIQRAKDKGCDGIDPDNIDGYAIDLADFDPNGSNPKTGFSITREDAVSYVASLTAAAHKAGLAIGLKNGLEILPRVAAGVDFAVNEECAAWDECEELDPFVAGNKPVFHIEYNDGSGTLQNMDPATVSSYCASGGEPKFSTILKNRSLLSAARWCDGSTTN